MFVVVSLSRESRESIVVVVSSGPNFLSFEHRWCLLSCAGTVRYRYLRRLPTYLLVVRVALLFLGVDHRAKSARPLPTYRALTVLYCTVHFTYVGTVTWAGGALLYVGRNNTYVQYSLTRT